VTWLRELPQGGRSYYTALGHKNSNYNDPGNYISRLLSNAVCWAAYDKNAVSNTLPIVKLDNTNMTVDQSTLYFSSNTSGIILTAPNGNCFELQIGNGGEISSILVTCPE
jgi:hypothetical protein